MRLVCIQAVRKDRCISTLSCVDVPISLKAALSLHDPHNGIDGPRYVQTAVINCFWHVLGSRLNVSCLLIATQVVALLGLRTRRDLFTGKVQDERLGGQISGAAIIPLQAFNLSRTPLSRLGSLNPDRNLISRRIKRHFVSQKPQAMHASFLAREVVRL